MSESKFQCDNSVSDYLNNDFITNIVPQKGAIYVSDGSYYYKLPPGADDQVLTVNTALTRKVEWQNITSTVNNTFYSYIFQLCVAYGGTYRFSSITPATDSSFHTDPETISFTTNVNIVSIGWKPPRFFQGGSAVPITWAQFGGKIAFDFVSCAQGATTIVANMVPLTYISSPHFTVDGVTYSLTTKAFHINFNPPIVVPANQKFCLRYTPITSGPDQTTGDVLNHMWIVPTSMWITGKFTT